MMVTHPSAAYLKHRFPKLPYRIYSCYAFLAGRLLRGHGRMKNAVKIMSEEWDYLIVLDACRYDYFAKLNNMVTGKLEKRISRGSHTLEWLRENFDAYYDDVIYISGNPYISNVEFLGFNGRSHFFRVESVWDYGWSEKTGTVHPQRVVEASIRMKRKYPDRKMIIHFLQPHAPYIGGTNISASEINVRSNAPKGETIKEILRLARNAEMPVNTLKRAYRDNLIFVLKYVKKLLHCLEGKIVITADHGECFGEWGIMAHKEGIYVKELVEVPWLVIEKGKKEICKKAIGQKLTELKRLGKI